MKACLENTSKDAKTYRRIAQELSDLGFDRNPNPVKEKMKSITKNIQSMQGLQQPKWKWPRQTSIF